MISLIRRQLADLPIYLASSSPRRQEILRNVGLPFEMRPSGFAEDLDKSRFSQPSEYVVENARCKAMDVVKGVERGVVIGADTVVVLGDKILEKPGTPSDAEQMLQKLSGTTHQVVTGVVILLKQQGGDKLSKRVFHVTTEVCFAQLSEEVIKAYVDSGEPMDKAGSYPMYNAPHFNLASIYYGIQGLGGTLVTGIHGDYFNVVGLPLQKLCTELLNLLQSNTI